MSHISESAWSHIFAGVVVALVGWRFLVVTYRLLFSPIAGFPGPKLAAASWLYEFYYDVVKDGGGLYLWQIEKLHEQYGEQISQKASF